ncbi:MAG TPA: hypothetical protein VKT49_19070 [Bryobacteraceae bacterium]|nr:hypothetical protein [Bryobacteraceae bacterium]
MSAGEFELYGHRFQWSEGESGDPCNAGAIRLIRMRRPFEPEHVEWLSQGGGYIPAYGKVGDCSAYRFEGVAAFLFPPDGSYVQMFIDPAADDATLEFVLFRGVLPRILHLRGVTCLHASAVALRDGVVALCGPSGAGKSTLAAALVSRGLPLVSDDVVPIRPGPPVMAGPGLPELRLYPSAVERIGISGQVGAPLPGQSKAHWQPRRAPDKPLPLLAIYLLQPATGSAEQPASLAPAPANEALVSLISNSYWVHPGQTDALGRDLLCLASLLRSVKVERLAFELSDRGIAAVEELITSAPRVTVR